MQVLGIAGSPRRRGNTETLLDRFLAGAESEGADAKKVVLSRLDLGGCIACDGCWKDGVCVVKDDFQAVHAKLVDADVVALAAPLFFWGLPSQTKALIDRGQAQWARKYKAKAPLSATASGRERRRGVFIVVGGEPEPYFDCSIKTVSGFFGLYQIDMWAQALFGGADAKGEIGDHPTALEDVFRLGVQAVDLD